MPKFNDTPSFNRDPLNQPLLAKSQAKRSGVKRLFETAAHPPVARNDLLPELKVTLVQIDLIKVPKRRLRLLEEADVQEVVYSIQRFGFSDPLLIGADNKLIDGESRLEAAKKLGLTHVPCIRAGHMDEDQARAARIGFNRIGQTRVWQVGDLKLEFQELDAKGQPIINLGFPSIQLDQIMAVEDEPVKELPAEALGVPLVTRPGDVWALGNHRLLCGDSTKPESYSLLLGDEKAQLVLADAPYNVKISSIVSTAHEEFAQGSGEMSDDEFTGFLSAFLGCCQKVMPDGGIALAFMDWKHIDQLLAAGKSRGFDLVNIITWIKHAGGMGSLWRSQHELIAAFRKPGKHKNNIELGKHGRDRTNVWFEAGANTVGSEARAMLKSHPTSKPPKLLMDAIYDVTDRGDIVLDPFGGSGSTLIAAHRTERVARLIELSPRYCDVILQRWLVESGEMPVHLPSGLPLDERARALAAEQTDASEPAEVPHAR